MAPPKGGAAFQRGCEDEVSSKRKEYSVSSTVKETCNTWVWKGMKDSSFCPLALVLWEYSLIPPSSLKSNSTGRKIALMLRFLSALSASIKKTATVSWIPVSFIPPPLRWIAHMLGRVSDVAESGRKSLTFGLCLPP